MLRLVALTLVLTLALTHARAPAQDGWETVTSKEGGFSVVMPGKLTLDKSRVRKGAGGDVKTITVACHGEGGVYMALKVILPTAIVKGTEDAELDAERNYAIKEWNGKMLAERKIRAENKVGRDFTIRGKFPDDPGTVTIRLREYLAGNAIYIVAVVSRPNRELPDDTGRFLGSLAIGGVRAAGTPTPEQKGSRLEGWGMVLDPLKDCEFLTEKNSLRLNVTGSRHQRPVEHQILNAPRVMREVEGDFLITVKVVGDFRPGGKSTNPKSIPFNGAGIIVFSDTDNFIRLERAAVNRGGRINPYVNFEEFEGGSNGVTHSEVMKGGDCWLRMERKGSKIHGSISFDGKTWKDLKPIQTVWPKNVKIGLLATSSSGLPFSVVFEEYQLKALTRKVE